MVQILHAVIPYLVGMNSSHKETVLSSVDLTDKVIVDFDEDTISYSQDVFHFHTYFLLTIVINIFLEYLFPQIFS